MTLSRTAGTATLTAMAGDALTGKISAKAETKADKALAKVPIRFTTIGDTDAPCTGGEKAATILTNTTGVSVAPALQMGDPARPGRPTEP